MGAYKTKLASTWAIAGVALALGLWDLYARRYPGGTLSEVLLSSARAAPLVPFLFGVLMGHLFWPQEPENK